MATDVEHRMKTCTDCASTGMVDGERCTTCNGQGFTRIGVAPESGSSEVPDKLERLNKAALLELADKLELEVPDGATNKEIIAAIRVAQGVPA